MPNPAVRRAQRVLTGYPDWAGRLPDVGPKFASPPGFPAVHCRQGRGRNQIVRGHALAELLEVEEEECLVFTVVQFRNSDRSAQREPVVVPVQWVLDVPGAAGVDGERQARVQSRVLEIVVRGAVVLVGARLHGVVDVSAAHLPILSREIAGLDRHFLNGVHTLLDRLAVHLLKAVGGVLAFHANGLRSRTAGR